MVANGIRYGNVKKRADSLLEKKSISKSTYDIYVRVTLFINFIILAKEFGICNYNEENIIDFINSDIDDTFITKTKYLLEKYSELKDSQTLNGRNIDDCVTAFINELITTFNLHISITDNYFQSKVFNVPGMNFSVDCIKKRKRKYTGFFCDRELFNKNKDRAGIYMIKNKGEYQYIGRSTACTFSRAIESIKEKEVKWFDEIEIQFVNNNIDACIYEPYFISMFKPQLNTHFIDEEATQLVLPELNDKLILNHKNIYIESEPYNDFEELRLPLLNAVHLSSGSEVKICRAHEDKSSILTNWSIDSNYPGSIPHIYTSNLEKMHNNNYKTIAYLLE